jgi:predicted Zn-dependent protease
MAAVTARTCRGRVLTCLLVAGVLLPACASRSLPPIGGDGRPFQLEPDERALWGRAGKEAEQLVGGSTPYGDPPLVDYLAGVGGRLVPEGVRAAGGPGLRFAVVRDPTLNAFALPDGRIYVHTGLLGRLENEAQLAAVLGREIAHVTRRHLLALTRDARSEPSASTVTAIAAGVGLAGAARSRAHAEDAATAAVPSPTANAILGLGLQLTAIASIQGYGRALEREADVDAMERLVGAGYDPREAPRAFAVLGAPSEDRGLLEPFLLGRRPWLADRLGTTEGILRTMDADAARGTALVRNTDEFDRRLRAVVRDNAALDVRAGRFALARRQLDRVLAITPADPIAHLTYGDLHRLQAQRARSRAEEAEHARHALARYERATQLDPTFADPYRQLGLLYYHQGAIDKALAAFEQYLTVRPDAPDAARIRGYLLELSR